MSLLIAAEPPIFKGNRPFPTVVLNSITTTSAEFNLTAPSFNGNSQILRYILTCIPGPDFKFVPPINASSANHSLTITGLHPGATYDCHYQAVNAIGTSGPSQSKALRLNDDGRYT